MAEKDCGEVRRRLTSPASIERAKKELQELEAKELAFQERLVKYRQENLIEYFTLPKDQGGIPANPPQAKLLEAFKNPQYKVFTLTGGNRLGKTTIGTILSICVMAGKWIWNGEPIVFPHSYPRRVRYIGQGWETHIKTVVEPTLRKWWPKSRRVETKKNNQGVEAVWTDLQTKSTLEILSNNQESKSFEGWEGDFIVWDEPPTRENRIASARGLVDRQGRELFVATLLGEAWIHREVIKAKNADGTPDLSVFNVHGEIYDNIGYGLTKEGVEQFAKTLREHEKQARLLGKPSYLSSLVWPRFNRDIHVKPRFKVPLDWIVDVQIDFHPAKPWYVLFMATDRRNFKYCIHEIVEKGNPAYIGEEIVRILKNNLYRVGTVQIDPLAKGDSNADDDTVYQKLGKTLAAHGIALDVASKDKENGISAIGDLLWTDNEMPSLFFFSDLKHTIQQVEDYMYDPETLKPSKTDDDMCECLYRHGLLNTQWYPMVANTIEGQRNVML